MFTNNISSFDGNGASIAELIERYCTPSEKEKGKYQCPVCEGQNLQFNKKGEWNCWNDPSSEHRSDIAKWLNEQERQQNPGQGNGTSLRRKTRRVSKKERDRALAVETAVSISEIETKVEELAYQFDPSHGVTEAKLLVEIAEWARKAGCDAFAAKKLLQEKLKTHPARELASDEKVKLAKRYDKINQIWGDRLRLNARTDMIELDGKPFEHLGILRVQLATDHNFECSKADFDDIVLSIGQRNLYDPIQQYLDDVSSRHTDASILDGLAARYFGTEAPIYEAFIRKTLIAAVARAYEPGCSVQHVPILQGKQGTFKSTFFKVLAGEKWFDDTMTNGTQKDVDERLKLHRFWFVEWAELETVFKKKDISSVKSFITTTFDHVRKPYGRTMIESDRRSILVGTTNEDAFLRDPTGNRRFWIIPVQKHIPIERLEAERDQIWAAAVHAYNSGEKWHLTSEEEVIASEIASEFEDYDIWEESIERWLDRPGTTSTSVSEILTQVFNFETGQIDRKHQMRVVNCLKRLGWSLVRKGKKREKFWVKKIEDLPEEVGHVGLPKPEPLKNMDVQVDRRGRPTGRPTVDRPHFEQVDRPLGRPTPEVEVGLPRRSTQNPYEQRISAEVDRPDRPFPYNFQKNDDLKIGDQVYVLPRNASGVIKQIKDDFCHVETENGMTWQPIAQLRPNRRDGDEP